jgi:hypothetical protein
MQSPSTSEFAGKRELLMTFHRKLCHITMGFMHLLKKDVPFHWDESAKHSFKALKRALTNAPLLQPPNYNKDLLLYLAASESTIGMVLVQKYDLFEEYVIYYLSRGLVRPKLNYSHVEKVSLVAVHAVQRLCHYIFFLNTTIIVVVNPFQYVLTRHVIGRNICI